jgi:hypothetical protein
MAAPVFNGLDNNPTFTENGTPVTLDNNATVTDADLSPTDPIAGATLTLTRDGGASPDDLISSGYFDEGQYISPNTGLVAGFSNLSAGTLTVTFSADAEFQDVTALVESLTYYNSSGAPPAQVQIDFTFDNGQQATGHILVNITAVNQAPLVDGTSISYYQPGTAGVTLAPGIQLIDDSAALTGATVSLSAHDTTDQLAANVGTTGITANYDSSTGVLTLSGSASVEAYRQVLATVAYSSSATEPMSFGVPRTVTWHVTDDGALSGTQSSTLDFFPYLDLDQSGAGTGFSTAFTEGGPGVAIVDTDDHIGAGSNDFASARIALTNAQAGDTLSAPGLSGFTIDSSVPGQLTLTVNGGSAPASTFEDALRHVVFNNANSAITSVTRDVTVTVTDTVNTSNVAHASIAVNPVNNPGSAADDTATTNENTVLQVAAAQGVLANDNDPDGLTVITGTVGTSAGGSIHFNPDGSYTYTAPTGFSGLDQVGYTAQDPFGSQVSATLKVTVNPLQHNTPSPGDDAATAPAGGSTFDGGPGIDTITFGFKLVDATISYVGNFVVVDGPGSHTVLTGFEVFNFTDGTVNNNDSDPLVDDLFYYSQNHDVWTAHADADAHYHSTGWHEGRDPDAFFSTSTYLSLNPSVKASGVEPLLQFDRGGWKTSDPSIFFDNQKYLAANPDVKAAGIDPLAHFLQYGAQEGRQPIAPNVLLASDGFDYVYYLQHNPDVAAAHVDPFQHYETIGWKEGRNPNAYFDDKGYLATYADVAAAGVNPLDHYDQYGWKEGRDPSVDFDTKHYLAAYADVAAAHIDPLTHFVQYGQAEGRSSFADGHFG